MMRNIRMAICIFAFACTTVKTFSQTRINTVLSATIDSMAREDQKPAHMQNSDSAVAEFQRVIRRNFAVIKVILNKYNFPGYTLVGKESSDNFWMLVQHSDFDIPFQKKVLKLMKAQVDKKNASGQKYAYLIDRININEGHQQVYGTQVNMGPNGTTIKPCIDTLNLDKRRAAVGLSTIKEYLKQCDDAFYELNKDRLNKPKEAKPDSIKQNHN